MKVRTATLVAVAVLCLAAWLVVFAITAAPGDRGIPEELPSEQP